jgi:hypothetical protein
MTDIVKGVPEDSRKGILLNDFTGGIVTDIGGLSLAANQSPDALNVFAWEGNLHFRGGYSQWSTLPAAADGAFTYYDINYTAHLVEWANGNMYDVTSGIPVLIASGVYTPGQTIAHAQLNGILYWSTLTVPLRQWNGTTEKAVSNSGGTGVIPPPACMFLVAFNGALVAVNYVATTGINAGSFIWSNVNDPTTWVGANTQTVGSNNGGQCVFAIVMGVAQVGVAPVKQFMVGKTDQLFLYSGALSVGSLIEQAVSSPVGILDGHSAVYIPTQQGLGAVMFLGKDGLFYLCNGIECPVASANIKLLTTQLVSAALEANPQQQFNAVYNQRFQYYLCDFGNNVQLAYKWDTGAWWYFSGWPSGVYATLPAGSGLPSVFVGANSGGVTGVYELAQDQTNDNGSPIQAYWTSAYIHGGKPERLKLFQELTMFSYNVGVQYAVTATGLPQSNGIVPQTKTLLFNDPAVGAIVPSSTESALWDQALWDQATWGGGNATVTQPFQIGGMKGPLIVPSGVTKWAPAGYPLPLRTGGAQFKIAWNAGISDFRVTSLKVAFLFQNENVGILPFSSQGQVMNTAPNPGDRFTNTGEPLPLALPVAPVTPYSLYFGPCGVNAYYPLSGYNTSSSSGRSGVILSNDGKALFANLTSNSPFEEVVIKIVPGFTVGATQTFSGVGAGAPATVNFIFNPPASDTSHFYAIISDSSSAFYLVQLNTSDLSVAQSVALGGGVSSFYGAVDPTNTNITLNAASGLTYYFFNAKVANLGTNSLQTFAQTIGAGIVWDAAGSGVWTIDSTNNVLDHINVTTGGTIETITLPTFIGSAPQFGPAAANVIGGQQLAIFPVYDGSGGNASCYVVNLTSKTCLAYINLGVNIDFNLTNAGVGAQYGYVVGGLSHGPSYAFRIPLNGSSAITSLTPSLQPNSSTWNGMGISTNGNQDGCMFVLYLNNTTTIIGDINTQG